MTVLHAVCDLKCVFNWMLVCLSIAVLFYRILYRYVVLAFILCEQRCSACISTHHIIVVRTPSTERMARLDSDGCELGELGSLRDDDIDERSFGGRWTKI